MSFNCSEAGLQELERELEIIADPRHERYAQWMTREEAFKKCGVDAAKVEVVRSWVREEGVSKYIKPSSSPRVLQLTLPVAEAERLFRTSIQLHKKGRQVLLLASDFFLPRRVEDSVAAIYGLHDLPSRSHEESKEANLSLSESSLQAAVTEQWLSQQLVGGLANQPSPYARTIERENKHFNTFLAGPDLVREMYGLPADGDVHDSDIGQGLLAYAGMGGVPLDLLAWYQEYYGENVTQVEVVGRLPPPFPWLTPANTGIQMMVGLAPHLSGQ